MFRIPMKNGPSGDKNPKIKKLKNCGQPNPMTFKETSKSQNNLNQSLLKTRRTINPKTPNP